MRQNPDAPNAILPSSVQLILGRSLLSDFEAIGNIQASMHNSNCNWSIDSNDAV